MPLSKDALRLTRLACQAQIISPTGVPGALSATEASRIYGSVARYGFTNLQIIPGGAQIASGDSSTVATLTGALWAYQEDLSKSAFEIAVEKLGVTLEEFFRGLPSGTSYLGHVIDIQAIWDGVPESAYVTGRFLSPAARTLLTEWNDYQMNGGGVRVHLARPVPQPAGLIVVGGGQLVDEIDVRIEPLFADMSKMFVQVTGMFPAPIADVSQVSDRVRRLRQLLWEDLADRLAEGM